MKFDAVIVIGLPESGRRDRTNADSLGVPVIRWRGFNANRLNLVADDETAVRSSGHVGCYLAHAAVLRLVTCLPCDKVLVIEDDATLGGHFTRILEPFETDADVIVLRSSSDQLPNLRVPGFGYGITKSGAARLLEYVEDRRDNFDFAFGRAIRDAAVSAWFLEDQVILHAHQSSLTDPNPTAGGVHSQNEEQAIIARWLGEQSISGGRFLEIGAMDGVKFSNCRALYQAGWSGVCVEPNPYLFTALHRTYQGTSVLTLCALVWPHAEVRTLHLNQDGLSTSIAPVFVAGVELGISFHGSCMAPTVTPDQLAKMGPFDFVSIDAEGADMEIVRDGKAMFTGTKLLCVEWARPLRDAQADDRAQMLEACARHGFTKLVGETGDNLILAR